MAIPDLKNSDRDEQLDLLEADNKINPTGDKAVDTRRKLELALEQRRLKKALAADDWDSLLDDE